MMNKMGNVVKFDGAQQMLLDLSERSETAESCMCVCIMVHPDGEIYTAAAMAENRDKIRPYVMVGALETMKRRIQGEYMGKLDNL